MVQFFAKTKVFKLVFMVFVFGIGFFTLGANIYIPFHYAAVMPRTPQPEAGRIYRMTAQYGTVVYVDERGARPTRFCRARSDADMRRRDAFLRSLGGPARLVWKASESITGYSS